MTLPPAAYLALIASGGFLLVGMLTGIWKYWHMMRSAEAQAPAYVDICHRAALLYAFACIVLQQLALHSRFNDTVNLLAVAAPIVFFAAAVLGYAVHGWLQDTDNQLRRPHQLGRRIVPGVVVRGAMAALIIGEIGGLLVLIAGCI